LLAFDCEKVLYNTVLGSFFLCLPDPQQICFQLGQSKAEFPHAKEKERGRERERQRERDKVRAREREREREGEGKERERR
jgi:hypothetical protein